MIDTLFQVVAFSFGIAGMGLLALSQKQHWERVLKPRPYPSAGLRTLRIVAAVGLGMSFALCIMADSPGLATLVWLMVLTVSALIVAFTLAYRPHWLGWLAFWTR